ncbi:energy-coupling factor transporter transmembrane component T [Caloramator sp. CAR-1]|uniref:energy-coupling factor transporter transmembrane component T family protein n=1 Tax=Caloramator sp. CAR-1 TaxID=3062777 RepID=UPI0026E44501|nr:energy-coupling factor transporter transmembrane component T [Caloramator sp. CAR-1]MDO6354049.1 energy-coupling factor transporter transmembrane component T [Caloramator sp. CAR-1]
MSKLNYSLRQIRFLDECSVGNSVIHRLNPIVKIIVTLIFIVCVVSLESFEVRRLVPFFLYPVIIISLSDIPVTPLLKRTIIALPFILGVGIFNLLIERNFHGVLIFLSLSIKSILTILSSLLLIATTGMDNIAKGLLALKVPKIFVLQLIMTYKYIMIFTEEIITIANAYELRATDKDISINYAGSILGRFFIRVYDRAKNIYDAMILRGFNGEFNIGGKISFTRKDIVFLMFWIIYFIIVKFYDVVKLFELILGVMI